VASIKIAIKIAGALKENGEAKADFQEAIEFLFGLETRLQNLQSISPLLTTPSQERIVQLEVEKIAKPLNTFFKGVEKFDKSLGTESKMRPWRTAGRKLQWALKVSKEVNYPRDQISIPMASLSILLQT
jgi:hypothetical protein